MSETFETIEAKEVKYGKRNFIEVARKKVTTDEGESEFINISKGFFAPDGSKRYRNSVGFPEDDDAGIKNFIIESLQEV